MGLTHYKRETGVAQWVWILAALCELEHRVKIGELRMSVEAQGAPWFSSPAVMHAALELSGGLSSTERRHIRDVLVDMAACGFVIQRSGDGLILWKLTDEGRARIRRVVDVVVALTPIVGGASA